MEIIDETQGSYTMIISKDKDLCKIKFTPKNKALVYIDNNSLIQLLKLREFQLKKLLNNKRPNSFFVGFKLNFILQDKLPDVNFYDRTKITVLDNIQNKYLVTKTDKKTKDIPELFTDGSFDHIKKHGGYAILIKSNNNYYTNQVKTKTAKGNNLIELLAVINGLEYLQKETKIRVITDSQYVIKGITEWLPLWKLNDFYTVNGTKAKNIIAWKKVYKLVRGKYIEFEWVKSHSEHFENTLCDMKAKTIMRSNKENS